MPKVSPDDVSNFKAYVTAEGIEPPFYLIESTAANDVGALGHDTISIAKIHRNRQYRNGCRRLFDGCRLRKMQWPSVSLV